MRTDVPGRGRIRRARLAHDQQGQSLVLVVLAMIVIVALTALAIDVAQWYQKHHQAQVAADAAALGVADCMGSGACTSASVGTSTGQTYASTNGVPTSGVTINTTSYNVTVTTQTPAPTSFAGLFGIHARVSARAVANWNAGSTPYSFFAGNTSCTTGNNGGLGLYFADNGGGNSSVPGVHTNGEVFVNNNSGSVVITGSETDNASGTGSVCNNSSTSSKNVDLATSGNAGGTPNGILPWPETYSPPTCTASNTATFWTTDALTAAQVAAGGQQITTGGVYCVTTSFTGTCNASAADTTGTIYLNGAIQGIEMYGPCVIVTPSASGSSAISGTSPFQYPLVYGWGLSNVDLPSGNGMKTAGAANPTVFIGSTNNGGGTLSLNGAIYAPGACSTDANFPGDGPTCSGAISGGTVEIQGNNQVAGFVEAENIWVDKNSFSQISGNGPANPFGGTALTQ